MSIYDALDASPSQAGPAPVTRALDQSVARRAALVDQLGQGVRVDPAAAQQADMDLYSSGNEFTKGLRRFGYSLGPMTQAFAGAVVEPIAPEYGAQLRTDAARTLQQMPQDARPEFETFDQAKAAGLRGLGSYAASALGEGIPSVGLNLIGGGVGGLAAKALGRSVLAGRIAGGTATMLPMEGGETALDIQADPQAMANTTPAERAALTLGRGSVNALAESIVPQILIAPRLMGQAARIGPGLGNAVRNTGLIAGAGALGEYGTEAAQDLTGQAAVKIARGDPLTSGYDLARANEAGIKGAIVGGGVGGIAGGVQALTSNIGTGVDAATGRAQELREKTPKTGDFVSRLRSITENPEQFGADITNTTLEALAKSSDLATEGRKAVGRGMEAGVDALGSLKTQIDKFVINNVNPEDRQWYAEQTAKLGSMTAGEYQIFKQALQAETGKEFVEGTTAAGTLLGKKAVEGAKDVWGWTKRVYDGATDAVRDRNAPKQSLDVKSYSAEDRQDILNRVSSVNSTLKDLIGQGSISQKRELANILLTAAENPSYFLPFTNETGAPLPSGQQSRVKQNILDGWKRATGTDLQEVIKAVSEGRRDAEVSSLVSAPLDKFMAARNISADNKPVLQALAQKQTYEELTPVEKRLVTTLSKKDPVALQERRDWLANEAYKTPFNKLAPAQKKQIDELAGKDLSAKDRGQAYFADLVRTVDTTLRQAEAQDPQAGVGNTGQIIDSMVQRTDDVVQAEAEGRLNGVTYDENGNAIVPEPWDGNRSPFDRDAYRASMVNQQFANRRDTTVPVQLSSDQLNAQQLAQIFGKKVKGEDKQDAVVDLTDDEVSKVDPNKSLQLSISPMSLANMVKTKGFRERFSDQVAEFREGADSNSQAAESFLSALAILNDRGVEIDPTEIGLPAGDMIKIKANVDLSQLPDNLVIRQQGKGQKPFTLGAYRKSSRRETNPERAAERAASEQQQAETAALREAYINQDVPREDIEAVANYYRTGEGASAANAVLQQFGLSPVDQSLHDDQSETLLNLVDSIDKGRESFDDNMTGQAVGLSREDEADAELRAFKTQPLERANTEAVAGAVREAKKKGGKRLYTPRRTAEQQLTSRARKARIASLGAIEESNEPVNSVRTPAATQTSRPGAAEGGARAEATAERREALDAAAREKRAEEAAADEKPAQTTPASPQQISTANARKVIDESKTVEELQTLLPRIEATTSLPKGIKQILTGMVQRKIEKVLNKDELTIRNASATVKGWVEKYAPDLKIRVEFSTELAGRGELKRSRNGVYTIRVNPDKAKGLTRMTSLAHEFGHALQSHVFDMADQTTKDAVMASYKADVEAFGKAGATLRGLGRTFLNPASMQRTETSSQADTPRSGARYAAQRDARTTPGYTMSFEEWFANQFVKHAIGEKVAGNVSEREAKFWNKVIKTVKKFFNDVITKIEPSVAFKDWITSLTAQATENAAATAPTTTATSLTGPTVTRNAAPADPNAMWSPTVTLDYGNYIIENDGGKPVYTMKTPVEIAPGVKLTGMVVDENGSTLVLESDKGQRIKARIYKDHIRLEGFTDTKSLLQDYDFDGKPKISVSRVFGRDLLSKLDAAKPEDRINMVLDAISKKAGLDNVDRFNLEYRNMLDGKPVGTGVTPPTPPTPPTPSTPPTPPGPNNDARAKFIKAVEQLVGKRISVLFDEQLTEGVAGTYESRDTALEQVREKRRRLLGELNKFPTNRETKLSDAELKEAIAATEAKEKQILEDKAVLGVIRVAAGMESKAGLAEHESFHGAFAFFFNAEERRALGTAFSQGLVTKRLKEYFKDQPEVLRAIDRDAEEAAAYGFQVWMHSPDSLKLGEKAQTLFGKLKEFLRKLFGLMTPEQRALLILNDLKSGRRAERGTSPLAVRLDKDRPWAERAQQYAKDIGGFVKSGYDIVLTSVYERLVDLENPAITAIAKKVYSATGEDGRSGMVQRTVAEVRRYQNEVSRIYEGLTDAQRKELHDANIFDKEPTDPVLKDRWNQVNKLYKDLYAYQQAAGVQLNNAGINSNYYPLTWDPEKVLKNKDAFMKMLSKYEDKLATAKKTPSEIYEGIVGYLERGEDLVNVMGSTNEPLAEHVRTRTLAFIEREDRREFMSDDPIATTLRYVRQAVRQAEFVRDFGMGGTELSALEAEAKKTYGATDDQWALVKDYIDGALGNKEVGMSRELKDLYGGLATYQNIRLLPFSLFASLVDPLGIAVRSNSIGDAFKTFTYSIKNLFRDWKSQYTPDEWEKIATDWGIIERAGTTINTDALYNGITLRGTTKKLNDAFFKYNLLNGWIRNNHIMAVSAAQRFFQRAAEGMFKEDSARYLEEVGLSKDDVIYNEQLGRILLRKDELVAAGKTEAEAEAIEGRLQEATRKFVRQSLLNPTAPELANWASNPYMAPIAHLKQFVWAFNATIINRITHELENNNYKPLMLAAAYVPAMIAADFLRDMVSNFGEEPPYKKDWGVVDYVKSGIDRSGLTSTGAFFISAQEDIMRGGSGYESFAGPSLEQLKKGLAAFSSGDGGAMERWFVKALPANAVYDQVLLN